MSDPLHRWNTHGFCTLCGTGVFDLTRQDPCPDTLSALSPQPVTKPAMGELSACRAKALEEAAVLVETQWNHCWPSDIAAAVRALTTGGEEL
jgi:hypothetical protein